MTKTKNFMSTDTIDSIVDLIVDDKKRIKENTLKYSNMSIEDAFADFYNTERTSKIVPQPIIVSVGSCLRAKLINNSKKGAEFEALNVKGRLITKTDVSKYPNLANRIGDEFTVKIIEKNRDGYVVDMFAPIFDEWAASVKASDRPVTVENLKLMLGVTGAGGYIGKVNINPLSEFTGKNIYVDAFIPGSQIVLNIESNFEKWNNANVIACVDSISTKPGTNEVSVICSVKKYLTELGNQVKANWYNIMSDDGKEWQDLLNTTFDGVVTGVINSSKKVGVFVEIPSVNITTLIPTDASKLTSYHKGQNVNVKVVSVDTPTYYDSTIGQTQHAQPYDIIDGKYTNIKVEVKLEFA